MIRIDSSLSPFEEKSRCHSVSTFLPHGKAGNRLPSVCREGIQDSIRGEPWPSQVSTCYSCRVSSVTLREVGLVLMGNPLWNLSWKIVRNLEFPLYMV